MRTLRTMMMLACISALGACATLSDADRATLTSASDNAQQAKVLAQQALDAARTAQVSSANAAASASQAATDAHAASEKADRMFQRSLRKTSP
jgi:hypothetical protein